MEHNKPQTAVLSQCKACGAALTRVADNRYVCEYCQNDYYIAENGTVTQTALSKEEIAQIVFNATKEALEESAAQPTPARPKRARNGIALRPLTLGALLTAMVIVLQLLGSFIRLGPFSVSLVLVPIVIGAATCGPLIGGWLGLVFGAAVLFSGDATLFLSIHAPGTILTVLLKGLLCALAAALVYKLLERFQRYVAVLCAAVVCPLVNTGIFLLGCRLFFWDTIAQWGEAAGFASTTAYAFLGLVGANFLFEMGFNLLLSPIIVRLLNIKRKLA